MSTAQLARTLRIIQSPQHRHIVCVLIVVSSEGSVLSGANQQQEEGIYNKDYLVKICNQALPNRILYSHLVLIFRVINTCFHHCVLFQGSYHFR